MQNGYYGVNSLGTYLWGYTKGPVHPDLLISSNLGPASTEGLSYETWKTRRGSGGSFRLSGGDGQLLSPDKRLAVNGRRQPIAVERE